MELLTGLNRAVRSYLVLRGVRSKVETVGDWPMHYYELKGTGLGPPIVLVHGLGGSANGFYKVMHPLARRFSRVVAPDLPGNGFSDLAGGPGLRTEAQFQNLVRFLEQVVGEPAFVVGNSLGGAMSITLAHRRPDLVRALGLVAPAGAAVPEERMVELIRTLNVTTNAEARALTKKLFHKAPVGALLLASDMRRMYATGAVRAIVSELKPTDGLDPDVLKSIQAPTLLIWGASEKLLPFEGIEYFRQHMPPHAEVHVVPGFGHIPQMERPGELVRHLIAFADRAGV